ncbi:hypothetical protein KA529_01165 [Candidatus Saccharibacteria bacterium]|nr:hypothetical protein [Candidatus Saccharibacteria bacterium]
MNTPESQQNGTEGLHDGLEAITNLSREIIEHGLGLAVMRESVAGPANPGEPEAVLEYLQSSPDFALAA